METKDFLTPKPFKIKAVSKKFSSTKFMTDLEKAKIYKNFVSFCNNHFSHTTFKKNIYQHFSTHCGFIAHNNINGFYGEYFTKGAVLNAVAFGKSVPMSENIGFIRTSGISRKDAFYEIYEEMNNERVGLGEFYHTIMNNRNYGGYSEYSDLDNAIKEVLFEYKQLFIDEIRKAIKIKSSKEKIVDKVEDEVQENKKPTKQMSLFDFMEAA